MRMLKGTETERYAQALDACDAAIFYDLRSDRELVSLDGRRPEPTTDRSMSHLRMLMAERCVAPTSSGPMPYRLSKSMFYDLRDAHSYTHERDPFKDWLEALPPVEVDPDAIDDYQCKIDWMVHDALGGDDSTYSRHISRSILLAAVWRTMQPGSKFDEVPVLMGAQGVGKDSLITSLVPWTSLETTSFSFSLRLKERIEVTRGCLFVVASEMGGVTTTKDLESLKSFVTATHDEMRMAYRRDSEHMPRRFIFVCTTNLCRPLPADPTGNRRWTVIAVDASRVGKVEDWVAERREAFWGEALALYKRGVKPSLPREMQFEQSQHNDNLERIDDVLEELYDNAIEEDMLKTDRPYTMRDAAYALKMCVELDDFRHMRREDQHRLRDHLTRKGWTSRRGRYHGGGSVKRLWYPPGYEAYQAQQNKFKSRLAGDEDSF